MKKSFAFIALGGFIVFILMQGINCSKDKDLPQRHNVNAQPVEADSYSPAAPENPGIKPGNDAEHPESDGKVLICKSKSAYAYHSQECKGLKRCKSGIASVTLEEAKKSGHKPCKYCY